MNDPKLRWRKAGMTSNGLRAAGEVINHFRGPGRMNILPNATAKKTMFALDDPISSIGIVQNNGLGQVAASEYGPGTLKSTNSQFFNQMIPSEETFGKTQQNVKRSQFVDYRSTAPWLVENLRKNPLSIYAVGDAKNAPIPAFMTYIQPDDYGTYKTIPEVNITESMKEQGIDGSPQVNILGLNRQNPFMGLTSVVNDKPEFLGKTYGGNDTAAAKPYANALYNSAWKTNFEQPVQVPNSIETFTSKHELGACKNDALSHFAQGYNIAGQIKNKNMTSWVGDGRHAVNNLPWGPMKYTNNPQTQEQGLWTKGGNPYPTHNTGHGYVNNPKQFVVPKVPHIGQPKNCYAYGKPGSLVC